MIKHIIFDFNGTLINDVDLCLNLLNDLLKSQGKATVDLNKYRNIFTFPIRDYYIAAGIDFNIESYESLAVKFIEKYQPQSLKCGLYEGVYDALQYLKNKNMKLYILSASEKNNLLQQCKSYGIDKYFDEILGITDIHAASKLDIGIDFIERNNISKDEILFIGDTLHDYEVAEAMGVNCALVKCGHQSVEVLSKANVLIYDSIADLMEVF